MSSAAIALPIRPTAPLHGSAIVIMERENGKLLVKRCTACNQAHHYPRANCPYCFSDKTEWTQASGKGVIYSHSTMRRAPIPYTLACVTLAEGPTMLTNLVDCDPDKLKIDQAVKLVFKPTEGGGPPVPTFTPA